MGAMVVQGDTCDWWVISSVAAVAVAAAVVFAIACRFTCLSGRLFGWLFVDVVAIVIDVIDNVRVDCWCCLMIAGCWLLLFVVVRAVSVVLLVVCCFVSVV